MQTASTVLVHLASGIGNIVLATPLLRVLVRHGYTVDVLVDGDYAGASQLLTDWSAIRSARAPGPTDYAGSQYDHIVAAIPPFYWPRYAHRYAWCAKLVPRPLDAVFYSDEQAYYLEFAKALGCRIGDAEYCFLPVAADCSHGVTATTLVLAPGCKTGEMAAKRWPYFPELAERFEDVVVVGTEDDLSRFDGTRMSFPGHVRSLVGRLTLRETAGVLAGAGAVVANDSGLGHVAGAVGTPTVLLFGPTPDRTLGKFPPNVTVLRAGLSCEPCWFAARFSACKRGIDCLASLPVARVAREVSYCLGKSAESIAEAFDESSNGAMRSST